MKRFTLVLSLMLAASCSTPPVEIDKPPDWFAEFPPAMSLNQTDLDPVRAAIAARTIVMLGESMQLSSELSKVRDLLIRNLHEEGNFNLLLFAGSPTEFWIAEEEYFSSKKDILSAADFQKTAMSGVRQTEEIRSVVDYALRSQAGAGHSDLYLTGYDVQMGRGRRFAGGRTVYETLVGLLQKRDKRISRAEEEAILVLEGLVSCQGKGFPESDEQYMQAEQGISVLSQVVARSVLNSDDVHEKVLALLPKVAGYSLEFCRAVKERVKDYAVIQDEWASRQFADLFSTLNQKALLWADSVHIRQSADKDGRISFGAHARGTFPEEIFAIHFTAANGTAVDFMDDKGNAIEPVEKTILPLERLSLEGKLAKISPKDFFVASKNLPAEFGKEETTRREPDGLTSIDPRKDYDGFYFIRDVTAPGLRLR